MVPNGTLHYITFAGDSVSVWMLLLISFSLELLCCFSSQMCGLTPTRPYYVSFEPVSIGYYKVEYKGH